MGALRLAGAVPHPYVRRGAAPQGAADRLAIPGQTSAALADRNPVEDQARALLAVPLLVAASDGNVSPDELAQIGNMCAFNPIFLQLGAERTHAILTEHARTLRSQGGEALLSAVLPALGPKLRETAMCFAIRVALADGRLEQGEIRMLEALAGRMDITMPVFEKIFAVMVMLQRGRE